MRRLSLILAAALSLIMAAGHAVRPAAAAALRTGGPGRLAMATPGERLAGSTISFIAGGLPPMLIALLALSYGWTGPLLAAFALGGAAYAILVPNDAAKADELHPGIRATAGAVRGLVFFPAMMALAAKRVYGPMVAEAVHEFRRPS